MGTNSFVRVPPDSTGKKLFTQQHTVGSDVVQAQGVHLSDPVEPTFLQKVDSRGQAFVRFVEGNPTIDAFNNTRVGEGQVLGVYEFSQGDMADLFQDITAGGGSATYIANQSNTHLSVTTASGDSVTRTTNRYHYYQPGVSTLVLFTLGLSDTGKANNVRRWGFFDEDNGIFFELNGTTLNVVLRTSVGGTMSETRVPQSAWNGDKLDGTGPSGMTLDVSKANFYGLDFAWLGVGVVRTGVWAPDGSRWVTHIFQNPNSNINSYMQTGTLPLRYENFNTGTTSGVSTIRQMCAAVYSQARIDYTYWRFSDIERLTPVTVTTDTPIFSLRVKAGSRAGVYPEAINVFVTGGAVQLSIIDDATLTGDTWTINGQGVCEGDVGATAITGGEKFFSYFVDQGVTRLDTTDIYEINDEGYHRLADDSDSYYFTLVATKLSGTTVTVAASLSYKELR